MIAKVAPWDHIRCGDGLLCEMPFAEAAGVAARWPIWERPTLCPRCRDVHELLAGPVEVRIRMVVGMPVTMNAAVVAKVPFT